MKQLAVIMPVYNEEEIIEKTVSDWLKVLSGLKINYDFIIYEGASTDNTLAVLKNLQKTNPSIIIKETGHIGHGRTLVKAYKELCCSYEMLFQADSDNEIPAEEFKTFWAQRADFDFITGIRQNRKQSLLRKIITKTAALLLKAMYGNVSFDTNCPFRLLRADKFKELFSIMPDDTAAPNIIISAYSGAENLHYKELPVKYTFRQTGAVSINSLSLIKTAVKSFFQVIIMYNKMGRL